MYGWFEDETLTGYAFCWEDNAQELLGADDAQMQGLLQTLGRGTLTVTETGSGNSTRLYANGMRKRMKPLDI